MLAFLVAVYRGEVQMKGYHIEPVPPGKAEAYAKKAMSILNRLGELEMICINDEFDEWWRGQWKIDKEKKQLVRGKGEKHQRARENWKKALAAIAQKKDAALQAAIDSYQEKCRKDNEPLSFR